MAEAWNSSSPSPVKRKRSVSLTDVACQKLKDELDTEWRRRHPSKRLTREAKAELLGVSVVTVQRIFRREGVDRATLVIAFNSLGLSLTDADLNEGFREEGRSAATPTGQNERPSFWNRFRKPVIAMSMITVAALGISYYADKPKRWDMYSVHERAVEAYHRGDLSAAEHYTEGLLEKSRSEDSLTGFTVALRNSADVAYAKGNYVEALSIFKECRRTWEKVNNNGHMAELDEAIGNVYLRLGDLEESKASFESCLKGQVKAANEVGMAEANRGLGSVAYKQGDLEEAKIRFETALRLLKNYDKEPMRVDIRGRMALVNAQEGDVDKGIAELKECLKFWQSNQSQRWCALIQMEIGELALLKGDKPMAQTYFKNSENTFRKVGDMGNLSKVQELATTINPSL